MPRSPNTPCSVCGVLCWPSGGRKGSLSHVCRACSRIPPSEQSPTGGRHGFSSTYRRGCRCELCRAAQTKRLASSNARRRALLRDPNAERVEPCEVFEADGWVCGICQEPVDRNLPWPDPLSPSLDHVVPLSRGGRHAKDNVRLAHLICNTRRGNREVVSVLA